jgi:hypothetical protein
MSIRKREKFCSIFFNISKCSFWWQEHMLPCAELNFAPTCWIEFRICVHLLDMCTSVRSTLKYPKHIKRELCVKHISLGRKRDSWVIASISNTASRKQPRDIRSSYDICQIPHRFTTSWVHSTRQWDECCAIDKVCHRHLPARWSTSNDRANVTNKTDPIARRD